MRCEEGRGGQLVWYSQRSKSDAEKLAKNFFRGNWSWKPPLARKFLEIFCSNFSPMFLHLSFHSGEWEREGGIVWRQVNGIPNTGQGWPWLVLGVDECVLCDDDAVVWGWWKVRNLWWGWWWWWWWSWTSGFLTMAAISSWTNFPGSVFTKQLTVTMDRRSMADNGTEIWRQICSTDVDQNFHVFSIARWCRDDDLAGGRLRFFRWLAFSELQSEEGEGDFLIFSFLLLWI